jgi:hypothetical protein
MNIPSNPIGIQIRDRPDCKPVLRPTAPKHVTLIESYLQLSPHNKMSQEYENWGEGQLLPLHRGGSLEMHKSIRRRIWMWDYSPQWTARLNRMSSTRTAVLINKTKVCIINVATYFCLELSYHWLHKKCRQQMYVMIYICISAERRSKNRDLHRYYSRNSLSYVENA